MKPDPLSDAKILDSWHKNAQPWTRAVRNREIDSRRQVTDAAIVNAVLSRSPASVLDIGCGEGWLARELSAQNIRVTGIDAVAELVEQANNAGGGDFHVLSYEQLAAGDSGLMADLVVCNFSMIGKESCEVLFKVMRSLLHPGGSWFVQTLHPVTSCGELPYADGWRTGSWAGFSSEFTDPAPWYFRTLQSWVDLFNGSGFRLREIREPIHPHTQQPVSVIFIAEQD